MKLFVFRLLFYANRIGSSDQALEKVQQIKQFLKRLNPSSTKREETGRIQREGGRTGRQLVMKGGRRGQKQQRRRGRSDKGETTWATGLLGSLRDIYMNWCRKLSYIRFDLCSNLIFVLHSGHLMYQTLYREKVDINYNMFWYSREPEYLLRFLEAL